LAGATRLRERLKEDDEVVLVAARDTFAMGFAKLWDLAGTRPIGDGTRSLTELGSRGVRFVHAEVTAIDPASHTVSTTSGELTGDGLLVALGARPSPAHRGLLRGPGAHDLYDIDALPAMGEALDAVRSGRVVVSILGGPFKCPPAPYEAALIVDERLRRRGVRDDVEVVVTTPQPISLPAAGVDASRYVAGHLDDHGVQLRSSHPVSTVDPDRRTISFGDAGPDLAYDLLLGVPADAPLPVLVEAGLAGDHGFVAPDPHTLRTDVPRVYAVGDCTVIPTASAQLPHAGVFAAAQARVAADNLLADLDRGSPTTFDGHGACFLELPGERVAFVEGDFYADPPDVALTPADHDQFLRKQAYERDHLDAWFS
jgi:sulfide:quinone oxidoreductase